MAVVDYIAEQVFSIHMVSWVFQILKAFENRPNIISNRWQHFFALQKNRGQARLMESDLYTRC